MTMLQRQQRVLHFIDSGGVYGAERVILNLSRELKCTGEFDPVVGCIVGTREENSDLYDASVALGIDAIKVPIRNHMLAIDLPRAARQLRREGVALVHSHGYKPSVFSYLMRPISRVPVMATCHLWFQPEMAPLKTKVMIGLERSFYRRFPAVVAVSDPIRDILVACGVPAHHVRVIPNGIDIRQFNAAPGDRLTVRTELGLEPDSLCILNTARLTTQKAQWALIEATAILRQLGVKATTLIVGQGELHDYLLRQIDTKQVGDSVRLLGFRADVHRLLTAADIFALPSLDEGMPISLLEAVAARVPVIVTGVGDIPKLIRDGEAGLVIPPADPRALVQAIQRVHTNQQLTSEMVENAYQALCRQFSAGSMAAQYSKIYRELLD